MSRTKSIDSCVLCQSPVTKSLLRFKDYYREECVASRSILSTCLGCGLISIDVSQYSSRERDDLYNGYYTRTAYHDDVWREKILCFAYKLYKRRFGWRLLDCISLVIVFISPRLYSYLESLRFLQSLSISNQVIDYGCGTGKIVKSLRSLGFNIYGFEPDTKVESTYKSSYIYNNLEECAKKCFDIMLLNHVIEHISATDVFFSFLENRLSVNGKLIVRTPNARSILRCAFKENWVGYDYPRHKYIYTMSSLQLLFRHLGFKTSRSRYCFSGSESINKTLSRLKIYTPFTAYLAYLMYYFVGILVPHFRDELYIELVYDESIH